jgi:hypothetical protein
VEVDFASNDRIPRRAQRRQDQVAAPIPVDRNPFAHSAAAK